jgi:hypothetical protein
MDNLKTYLPPLGRLLISSRFIWDGIGQLRSPSVFPQYFASVHVPLPNVAIPRRARSRTPRRGPRPLGERQAESGRVCQSAL